ncbi:hypothetical protein [Streptomyces mirabilis]|uniref:hypothetical protein n=1 Tax=Streptomyces mirabilis TaxID=68239 RepID=UPI0035E0C211
MSSVKRESIEPGPEALAYAAALKKIFTKLQKTQREVADLLSVDPSVLSRFLSGKENVVAAKEYADALVRLVRDNGGEVSSDDFVELHRLRKDAQDAAKKDKDRVAELRQEMQEVKALLGTFRGRVESIEATNAALEERVEKLMQQLDKEVQRTAQERGQREEAEERAARAELDVEKTSARLNEQLGAAAQYARESDALIDAQREDLRQLRQEVKVLRTQIRALSRGESGEATGRVAAAATQASEAEGLRGASSEEQSVGPAPFRRPRQEYIDAFDGEQSQSESGGSDPGQRREAQPPGRGRQGEARLGQGASFSPQRINPYAPAAPAPEELPRRPGRDSGLPAEHRYGDFILPGVIPGADPGGVHSPLGFPLGKAETRRQRRRSRSGMVTRITGGISRGFSVSKCEILNFIVLPTLLLVGLQIVYFVGLAVSVALQHGNLDAFRTFSCLLCATAIFTSVTYLFFRIVWDELKGLTLLIFLISIAVGLSGFDMFTFNLFSDAAHELGKYISGKGNGRTY